MGEAARLVYEFCGTIIATGLELSKYYLYARRAERLPSGTVAHPVLLFVLEGIKVASPVYAFYLRGDMAALPGRFSWEPLVVSPWPRPCRELNFPRESTEMAMVQKVIRAIRNLRSQVQLPPTRRSPVVLRATAELEGVLRQESHQLARLALAER